MPENPSLQGFGMNNIKEEKDGNYYGNPGFNQALGLAPQSEEDVDNFEAKGKYLKGYCYRLC